LSLNFELLNPNCGHPESAFIIGLAKGESISSAYKGVMRKYFRSYGKWRKQIGTNPF